MTTIAISMCKDEGDIITATVRRMARQVDALIIADNGSTDGTREQLADLARDLPLTVLDDPEVGYFQSRKMTALAARAHDAGADWIVPFDADEVWYSPHGRIADVLATFPHAVAHAEIYDHVATGADTAETDPIVRTGWRRRDAGGLPKVACRPTLPVTIHQGNHGASYDPIVVHDILVVRHFPYRSAEQFVSKARNGAAAYAATDLPEDQGQHWRDYGRILAEGGPEALSDVFRTWFWVYDPAGDDDLIYDPCPA